MMIVTTTGNVEGKRIVDYKGVVFGEVITGINMFKDIGAGLRNIFGGRSGSYENELSDAREQAMIELVKRAEAKGANAVVGIDVDYEILGEDNGMLMVSVSGTAVVIQ